MDVLAPVSAISSIFGIGKSKGGYQLPPERPKSEYEQYLENMNKETYGKVTDFWGQAVKDYTTQYNNAMSGIIPDAYKENSINGMKQAINEINGAWTAGLAKNGALGSSAYDRFRNQSDQTVASQFSKDFLATNQFLSQNAQNKATIAGDWLKYPHQAWTTETSLRRGANTADYKPAEASPFTSLLGGIGGLMGGGSMGGGGGGYNPNFFGGASQANAWGTYR